jgi:hypothetical protein
MSIKARVAAIQKRLKLMGTAPSARVESLMKDITAEEAAFIAKAISLLGLDDETAAIRALSDEELDRRIAELENIAAADLALAAAGTSLRSADLIAAQDTLAAGAMR